MQSSQLTTHQEYLLFLTTMSNFLKISMKVGLNDNNHGCGRFILYKKKLALLIILLLYFTVVSRYILQDITDLYKKYNT